MRHTDETKRKLSEQRTGSANPMFGRKHTAEAREKMANATRARNALRQYELAPQKVRLPDGVRLGYLAGLVDGEGSMRFRAGRPFVAVYGELVIAEWLKANVGGTYGNPDRRGRIPNYCWTVQSARDVYAVCRTLHPLLIVKADDAALVIKDLEDRYGREKLDRMDGF